MKDYTVLEALKRTAASKIENAFERGYDQGYHDGKLNEEAENIEKLEKKAEYKRGYEHGRMSMLTMCEYCKTRWRVTDFSEDITMIPRYEEIRRSQYDKGYKDGQKDALKAKESTDKNYEKQEKAESEAIKEFKKKILESYICGKDGTLKVGSELVIYDIEGPATFVIAHLKGGKAYVVRKWLLDNAEERPLIDSKFNAFDWLNGEYRNSLPDSIKAMIYGDVTLPSEKEVFGQNIESVKEEGEQFEWFKSVANRVTAYKPDDKYTREWWTRSKVSISAFAYVYSCGNAGNDKQWEKYVGLRPHFVLKYDE